MIREPGGNAERRAEQLCAQGWLVYCLPSGIGDQESFFEAVKAVIPLDPPLIGNRSWDALSDSLWGGLDGIDTKRIAIVWPQVDLAAPYELEIALSIFEELIYSLGDAEATNGSPKEVCVLIT